MNKYILLILSVLFIGCAGPAKIGHVSRPVDKEISQKVITTPHEAIPSPVMPEPVKWQNLSEETLSVAFSNRQYVLMVFETTWCPKCAILDKNLNYSDVSNIINKNFVPILIIDDSTDILRDILEEDPVYPTMLLISPERKVLLKITGTGSKEQLKDILNKIVVAKEMFEESQKQIHETKQTKTLEEEITGKKANK